MLLLAWAITAVMTVLGALSYGELAAAMPRAGGQYVFLREAFGPLFGFLYGWTLFLVIQTGTIAAVAVAFAKFLGLFVPWVSTSNGAAPAAVRLQHIQPAVRGHGRHCSPDLGELPWLTRGGDGPERLYGRQGRRLARTLVVARFCRAGESPAAAQPISGSSSRIRSTWRCCRSSGASLVGSLFSADAWNNVTFTGSEVVNPKRNLPLSLFSGP